LWHPALLDGDIFDGAVLTRAPPQRTELVLAVTPITALR